MRLSTGKVSTNSSSIRINQFEIDFMMALVLKYGVMKMNYNMMCGELEIERLLKAISIYIFP